MKILEVGCLEQRRMSATWYFPNYRICLAILSPVTCNIETHKFSSFGSLVGTASNYPCSLGMVENAFQTPSRDKIGRKCARILARAESSSHNTSCLSICLRKHL